VNLYASKRCKHANVRKYIDNFEATCSISVTQNNDKDTEEEEIDQEMPENVTHAAREK